MQVRRWAALAAAVVIGVVVVPVLPGAPVAASAEEDRRFVVAAFEDLIGRTPTEHEQQRLVARLAAGVSRGTVASELVREPQWVTAVVSDLYRSVLEREPDSGGLAYWVRRVGEGERIASLAAQLYASPETYARAGGTDDGYVHLVYLKVLGRAPDATGRAYWIERIRREGTRQHVARSLFLSPESNGRRVDDLYGALLGRAPDATGRAFWADRLRSIDDIALAASLVGSAEYFARAQVRPPATPLQIVVPSPLPPGTIGEPYSVQLDVTGGTPPYRWQRETGRPDYQVVDGRLFGTPEGFGGPRVVVTDRLGRTAQVTVAVPVARPVVLAHRDPPPGVVGAPYRAVLDAAEGTPPFTYEATDLPAGLAFEDGQVIVGVPTTAGTITVEVRVTDAVGRVAVRSHHLVVRPSGAWARLTSSGSPSLPHALSGDGAWLVYRSSNAAGDHLPDAFEGGDREDLLLMHTRTGRVRPVPGDGQGEGDISDDGRFVVFDSRDQGLAPGVNRSGVADVFLWDTTTDAVVRVTAGTSTSNRPRISGDGRYVVYQSQEPFGVHGTGGPQEVYRWDRLTGETLQLTTSRPGLGAGHPSISDDGSVVGFHSAGMLPDDGVGFDAGVWTEETGTSERISILGGGLTSGQSVHVSGDGSSAFFTSEDEEVGVDANGWGLDLFVWDRATRTSSRITSRPTSAGNTVAPSVDGDEVTYADVDLSTGVHRLFRRDRTTGVDTLLHEGPDRIGFPVLSADGGTLVVQGSPRAFEDLAVDHLDVYLQTSEA